MTKEKIIQGLKNLSTLADKREVPLEEVAHRLLDLLMVVEDFIEECKREKCKQIPTIPKKIKLPGSV